MINKKLRYTIYLTIYLLTIVLIYNKPLLATNNDVGIITEEGFIDFYSCKEVDCSKTLVSLMNKSKKTTCVFYDLTEKKILSEIKNNNKTRIFLYEENFLKKNKTLNYSKNIKPKPSKGLLHDKFCTFGNDTTITGSWNPTQKGTYLNDNYIIIINSNYITKLFRNKEQSIEKRDSDINRKSETKKTNLWNKKQKLEIGTNNKVNLSGTMIEVKFCPEDNCEEKIIKELNKSNRSVKMLAFTFTSKKIEDELELLDKERGVNVSLVFEKTRITKYSAYEKLKTKNINVLLDGNKNTMHEKMIIIDDRTLIVGSYNPTKNANTLNDENLLIIRNNKELLTKAIGKFNRIMNEAKT